jgi:hypothetical protein
MQLNLAFLDRPDLPAAVGDDVGATRRSLAHRGARDPLTSHRPHDLGQVDEGGKR